MRDVVIVGAGVAGSSLAVVLSTLGWDVLLVERRHLPQHKVCGEFLSPESQASLHALGLYTTVAKLGPSHMSRALLTSRGGRRVHVALPGEAWGVSRFALDTALADAARSAGADVRMGVTVTHMTQGREGATVELRTGQEGSVVKTRAVVLACGRHTLSSLRPSIQATPVDRTYVGVKCHYEAVSMPSRMELYFFPGGYGGISPIEGGRFNLCLLATRAAFLQSGGTVRAMLERATCLNPTLGQRLQGSTPLPETEVAVAPVDTERQGTPWATTACIGDAAVMIPPLCGDGQAMALRSAELYAPLLDALLHGRRSLADVRATYTAAWHREFDGPVRTGRWLQTLLNVQGLSDGLISLGQLVPALAQGLVRATRGRPRPLATVTPIARTAGMSGPDEASVGSMDHGGGDV